MDRLIDVSALWYRYSAFSDEFRSINDIVRFLTDNKVTVICGQSVEHNARESTFKLAKVKSGHVWRRLKRKSM